ncbi:MAG: gamma-glutamyltransferase [Patulibacter sp.]|nr:gamma-glutamyltransferase [Patulibacter sp.]
MSPGTVAAGHPETAAIGAQVLREGGSAVDAAVAAVFASWVCEPLLTGPAAGGHLLAVPPDGPAVAIDAFCAVPGLATPTRAAARGGIASGRPDPIAALQAVDVDFGDAHQIFHVGGASVAAFGLTDGLVRLHRRWGRLPLADLAAPAAALARRGVALNRQQAYVATLLERILALTAASRALWFRGGAVLREGERFVAPELGDTIERLGRDGAEPLRTGDLAAACVATCVAEGGLLTARDLADYVAIEHEPLSVAYRDRTVLTAPPSSAGGVLLAMALGHLHRAPRASASGTGRDGAGPPSNAELIAAMARADAERTPEFDARLFDHGYADRLLALRLGSTTHLSVIDADGLGCAITCTNGEGSGVVVPGTGIHLNNVMGEEDLNPRLRWRPPAPELPWLPPGRRMPSMMAPTAVQRGGETEAMLGSAGSSRIRSALLQTIVGLVDHGRDPVAAVEAPRLHVEDGTVYVEPGVELPESTVGARPLVRFRERNLFFGGVQVVARDPRDGTLGAAGDPRRGGAVVVA